MSQVDPVRHPLLHHVSQGAQWIGKDEYPAFVEWADEHERWLRFACDVGAFDRYLSRLRSPALRRDETLAELGTAYFLGTHCGYRILEWEPLGADGKRGDLLIELPGGERIFVEIKSPGWEAEVARIWGQSSPRLGQPKYLDGEGGATAPWEAVRGAVRAAHPKLPDAVPTLLVINDDLMVGLNHWLTAVDIALYCPRGLRNLTGYLAEDGSFVGSWYGNLGAVGILNIELRGAAPSYLFRIFHNPGSLGSVRLPTTAFPVYPHHHGPR